MSSRAMRRAERELAEKQLQEKLAQEELNEEESEDEVAPSTNAKPSLFALLGDDVDDEENEGDEDSPEQETEIDPDATTGDAASKPVTDSQSSKKSKKKKKKGKAKAKDKDLKKSAMPSKTAPGLDEIDKALLALNITSNYQTDTVSNLSSAINEERKQLFLVLSVDTQHLHAANEMKKLFGRAALQNIDEEQPRARQRVPGPGNRNLASIGLRRNIFIQGKEEWPRATSGGLGMEIVEKRSDGTVEYRFVHNTMYQEVQREFQKCVSGMDPERMVELLRVNPYHISTLLQVSEIVKQQRDNATASDLLERTLFTFGRSVHSTFSTNLAAGKARLDFRRPENREFWLAIWRYITALGVRSTWRTALEWAKLLIAMSPEQDPYCMRFLIDQLALRGRDPQALVDMAEADYLQRLWKVPPNIAFSIALAHDRLKEPQKARSTLRNAVKEYPWLAARLCKELDISPVPKSVWGKEPNDDHQELLCQLYIPKAKDLWNTTEGTSLLVEVCCSIEEELGTGENPYWLADISETDLARHVILSDDRSLLSLLDNRVKSKYTSVSDPLPPEDNLTSYTMIGIESGPRYHHDPGAQEGLLAEIEQLREYFESLDIENLVRGGMRDEDLMQALEHVGSDLDEFRRNTIRFQLVRTRLPEEDVDAAFEGGARARGDELEIESDD